MATEIKILVHSGKRLALYRQAGTASKYWHRMPVRQAEKAIKEGRVSIGVVQHDPVVTAPVPAP